ncbi:MAG: type IV pilus modification protein PilV [Pseudomonadota bacterium]
MRASGRGGFTLIEVLVAMLLLSLGLISSSAMQSTALRTRQQSALLSNAVQLAAAMAERMRANTLQMAASDAANPYLNVHYDATVDGEPESAPPCFAPANCSSFDLARVDLYDIKRQVAHSMPGGQLVICRDASAWDPAAHALRWACDHAAHGPVVIKLGWRAKAAGGARADEPQAGPRVAVNLHMVSP